MKSVTIRAAIVGVICVVIMSIFSPYSDLIIGTVWSGATYLPLNVIIIFMLLVAFNIILRKLKIGLHEHELLYIYCMMLVVGCIVSLGFVHSVIPITTAVFYRATKENMWQQVLHPHIPKWFAPASTEAIKYLWEGIPKNVPIPWKEWIVPFIAWATLAIGMYIVMYSLCLLLQRQWIANERLTFPLVYLPLELSKEEEGKALPPILRNNVFWYGFFIAATPLLINGLHRYFPFVPSINLSVNMDEFFKEPPWTGLSPAALNIIFSAIGLTYLLPTSLSFSLWFFFIFFRTQAVIGTMFGAHMPFMFSYPTRAFISYQIAGGMIVFCIFLLWCSRNELKKIFYPVSRSNNPSASDSTDEGYLYKKAFIGLFVGLSIICGWAIVARVSVLLTLCIFLIFFIVVLIATRLAAEGGVYFFQASFRPSDIIMPFTGSTALGVRNVVNLIGPVEHIFMRDQRAALMPNVMDILKISDTRNLRRKTVIALSVLAILIGMVSSYAAYLKFMYRAGGINLSGYTWCHGVTRAPEHTFNLINMPQKPDLGSIGWLLFGGVSMVILIILRRTVLWLPLHPLGYVMGDSWPTVQIWFPIMIGWLLKTLILRLGGIKGYRKLMPGFLGLIVGEYSMIGLWVLIDMITGVKGHTVAPFL
jgi:hypothetical protein